MKRSLLAIILAVAMLLSFGVFAACQPDTPGPDPKPQPSGGADVPIAEGKVTLYFTMADDSVALPEYASVWFTGAQTGWAEKSDGALECINVEGTKLYYVQLAYNAEVEKPNEYHLTLGYNSKSGLPADKLGVNWNLKSDAAATLGPLDNLTFEYDGTAQKIDLGTHKWSTEIAKPERIAKTEVRVTFSEALGEKAEVYIMGDFNSWTADKAKATPNADRTVYSLELTDMLCTGYTFKILVFKNIDDVQMKDAEGKDIGIWDRTSIANPTESAYIEISDNGNNIKTSINKVDNGSHIDLCETVSEGSEDMPKKGMDLSKAFKEQKKDNDGKPIDNAFLWKLYLGPNYIYTVKFATALAEGSRVFLLGDMNKWCSADSGIPITDAEMKLDADRKVATLGVSDVSGSTYSFKVVVVRPGAEINVTKDVWNNENPVGDKDNHSITLGAVGAVDLFDGEQEDPTANAPVSVTLTCEFSAALEGKRVFIAGAFTAWGDNPVEMTTTDNIHYTATIASINIGESECKVVVCDDDFTWDGVNFGNAEGGNVKITVTAEGETIAIFAEPLVMPAA